MSTLEVNTITPQSGTTLTLGGSGDTINLGSGVTASGFGGITEADQWRVTSSSTITSTIDITTNLARMSGDGFGKIGTGMSQSSGVFTFPNTGYWYVSFKTQGRIASSTLDSIGGRIRVSTDGGSSYSNYSFSTQSGSTYLNQFSTYTNAILDVDDTSQIKIIFSYQIGTGTAFADNDATQGYTQMTFIRLGDT